MVIKKTNNANKGNAKKGQAAINEEIHAKECRLISNDGDQLGIVDMREALRAAREAELDLVQIATGDPIVCKIMDYGKYLFEQKKSKAMQKKKQKQVNIKEIKFRPATDEGDYQVKLRNMTRFIEDGDKVKVTLRFSGREKAHQDIAVKFFERLEQDVESIATIESKPKFEGGQMIMMLAPKKK